MSPPSARPEPSSLGARAQAKTHKAAAQPRRDRPEARQLSAALDQPHRASAADILQLQRVGGNRAVQRLLAQQGVQARLTVGPADDRYEREADRVANAVLRSPAPTAPPAPEGARTEGEVQRQPAAGKITPLVQRHAMEAKPGDIELDQDELRQAAMQRKGSGGQGDAFEAGAALENALSQRAGQGQLLDPGARDEMEAHFGADFGGVRVHADGEAARLNRSVSANAFTHGQDIYFGAGQYAPASSRGKFLLAHELTHVVQQSGGRVRRKRIQRANIARGQQLPDLSTALGQRTNEFVTSGSRVKDRSFEAQVERFQLKKLADGLADDAMAKYVVGQALGQAALARADDILRDVRAAFAQALTSAKNVVGAQFEANKYIKSNFAGQDQADRLAVVKKADDLAGTIQAAAKEFFVEKRRNVQMAQAYLPGAERATFAAALKQMPIVRQLLNPNQAANQTGGQTPVLTAEWRDPGKLSDKVQVKHSKGIPDWLSQRREKKQLAKFKAKIDRVDQWLRALVEPDILQRVRRPVIRMHTRGRMKIVGSAQRFFFLPDPTGYRPSAGGGSVELPFDEVFAVMAHEMGHAIEDFLPMKSWHDMNLLLERRHSEKVGTSRAARTGATFWTSGRLNVGPLTNEGRYAGRYVTGKYTSTAYDDSGNAEVFSQAMEFFAKPANALKLIEGDPQHAAIVLRAIRPNEYKSIAALRPFDKYLPIKASKLKA